MEEIAVEFILNTRNEKLFILKTIMGNYGESDHCYFLDVVATVDVLTASNNDVNFVETRAVHFT